MNIETVSEWLYRITQLAIVLSCVYSIYIIWQELKHYSFLTLFFSGLTAGSLVILGYGCLILTKHFSVDSFNEYYDIAPFFALSIGRYINSGINIIVSGRWHINQTMQQQPLILMWCLSLSFFIWGLSLRIADTIKEIETRTVLLITTVISIGMVNPFMMELILFPEMASPLAIANISGICAIFSFSEFMRKEKAGEKIIHAVFSALMFLIVIGTYQEYLGILVSSIIVLILVDKNNKTLEQLKWIVTSLIYGAGASIFNVWIVSHLRKVGIIANTGRGAELSFNTIKKNILAICKYFLEFVRNANGLVSGKIMIPFTVLVIFCLITNIILARGVLQKFIFCLAFLGCLGLAYAPHIVESNCVLNARSTCAVWNVLSTFSIVAIIRIYKLRNSKVRVLQCFIETLAILSIVINIVVQQDMAANQMVTYTVDRIEAEAIVDCIENYEAQNNVEIKNIATIGDKNETMYDELSQYHDRELGKRIMATPYSNYRLINYLSHRNLKVCDVPKSVREKAETNDWTKFDPAQQVIFVGDTVSIIVY